MQTSKRDIILQYFGHRTPERKDGGHNCCDHHRNICKCELCNAAVSQPQVMPTCDAESELPAATTTISKEHRDLVRQNFFLTVKAWELLGLVLEALANQLGLACS